MKKLLIIAFLLGFCSIGSFAQSSMTDEQVMQFVLKEYERGTSQAQIVTKLMQRGVDINQIRRVKNTYDRMQKNQGLGTVDDGTSATSRMRVNNGDTKEMDAQEMQRRRLEAQRGTSQSMYFLGWETGLSLGVGMGYLFFNDQPESLLYTALSLTVAALLMYHLFTHSWFVRNKNR